MAFDVGAAREYIKAIRRVREDRSNETVIRQTIIAGLQDMYPRPDRPWWVERHIVGAEYGVNFDEDERSRRGSVDSVVGLTAIEYEANLIGARFNHGRFQVQQYCAGLLNQGADPDDVRGLLSDGVDWYAYRIAVEAPADVYATEHVRLIEIDHLNLADSDEATANRLDRLLSEYLGRPRVRPLNGPSIAEYIGLNSAFGTRYVEQLASVLDRAQEQSPDLWDLVADLWKRLAGYLDAGADDVEFSREAYLQELYLSILAKMFCANVIEQRAISSSDTQLDEILSGAYFEDAGLHRLVEHDYFGWIHSEHPDLVRQVAAAVQADLTAYNFSKSPEDDLFGHLMAELGEKSHRILLGQEWTPSWLAERMARYLFEGLRAGEDPHFVDMCCGSGSMLVEVNRLARDELSDRGTRPGSPEALRYLEMAAVGFDIDPLAVILAKVNWVATNRDWLAPFDGSKAVSVPVYHADSLFALNPLGGSEVDDRGPDSVRLELIDGVFVDLPNQLVDPALQTMFDLVIDGAYGLAMTLADLGVSAAPSEDDARQIVSGAQGGDGLGLQDQQVIVEFVRDLTEALLDLQRRGRNGIWAFIIRNTYRPGLVAGQFNGLISNPPWLALSKIGHNPLHAALTRLAERYRLVPGDSSFLHLELATTFLAHSVDHYLRDDAGIACILPHTVMNGQQHSSLREQLDGEADALVKVTVDEIWLVEKGVFKNRALVLCGRRGTPTTWETKTGLHLGHDESQELEVHVQRIGARHNWGLEARPSTAGDNYRELVQQGADVMPRTAFLCEATVSGDKMTVAPIDLAGDNRHLVGKAKKMADFRPAARTISNRFVHGCLLSHHLVAFRMAAPAPIVAPIRRDAGTWKEITSAGVATDRAAQRHFAAVVDANEDWASLHDIWTSLNFRNKLTDQLVDAGSWVVFYGAGGGITTAACLPVEALRDAVIDQTLYWVQVETEDEALYLVGMLNSPALGDILEGVPPEGEFGARHLHKLPAQVTPRFDAQDAAHLDVVRSTRALSDALDVAAKTDGRIAALMLATSDMNSRRGRVRKLLEKIPGYDDYVDACANAFQ